MKKTFKTIKGFKTWLSFGYYDEKDIIKIEVTLKVGEQGK
jgi:hypothetical protein